MDESMRIGELMARAGVTARAIRHYENIGILPSVDRTKWEQHRYSESTVLRLRKVAQLKAVGLSLEEIADVIDLYFTDPSGVRAKRSILAILRRHLRETDRKMETLGQFRAELMGHIERFERWLSEKESKETDG
jgi:DNA-binding transcriptional MerR regulator